MKPVQTKDSNVRLIHPEEEHLPDEKRVGDVPVERMFFRDPETEEQRPGFESTWQLSVGERKALANGAPITIQLWGANHPPIKPMVGDPDPESMEVLVTVEETRRAAGKFFERLSVRMGEDTEIGAKEIPAMFNLALEEILRSRNQPPSANGNGS